MTTQFIKIDQNDTILAAHTKHVMSLHNSKFGERVLNLSEIDISSITQNTKFKKGDTLKGIWQLSSDNYTHKQLIRAMVCYLNGNITDKEQKTYRSHLGEEFSQGDLSELLTEAKLSVQQWQEQYSELGKDADKQQKEKALKASERTALLRTNIDDVTDTLNDICYTFPAIAGKMGTDIYYTIMIPFQSLAKIFNHEENNLDVELRVQRQLNSRRADAIASYIVDRKDDFVLPALTASVSEHMLFEPAKGCTHTGTVHIPMGAKFCLNDGQHRAKGIEEALRRSPNLKDNMVSVVMFYDQGLVRSQQIFADINTNSVKPSRSLSILFDKKNKFNALIVKAINDANINHIVEYERASPAKTSSKIWGITAIKKAAEMVLGINDKTIQEYDKDDLTQLGILFSNWLQKIVECMPGDFADLVEQNKAEDVMIARDDFITTHAAFLYSLALFSKLALVDFHNKRIFYIGDRGPLCLYRSRKSAGFSVTTEKFPSLPTLDWLNTINSLPHMKDDECWLGRIVNPDNTMNPKPTAIKLATYQLCKKLNVEPSADLIEINEMVFGQLLGNTETETVIGEIEPGS